MQRYISYRQPNKIEYKQPTKSKSSWFGKFIVIIILAFGIFYAFALYRSHANAESGSKGISSYCLENYKNSHTNTDEAAAVKCNKTPEQKWSFSNANIINGSSNCLGVEGNGTTVNDEVGTSNCNSSPGQVWLIYKGGYENPNSGMCLGLQTTSLGQTPIINSCSYLIGSDKFWVPANLSNSSYSCSGKSQTEAVACYAEQEWTTWQSGTVNHNTLLNEYSDGNGYEEWCADFVSYVYKEAGYPFDQGERDGWDEYNANNVQYQGFTENNVGSYIPKPGDVAFFDYPGGHVEIVVSGGSSPTFIYGDSATTDPTTGNGEMEANTKTSDGSLGQVTYYLTPN
jgi:hypothetical protein